MPLNISDKLKNQILESIGEGVFTVDKNFKINFFNKAAEKITGYKREDVLGRFCKHIFKSEACFLDCPMALVLKSQKNIFDFDSQIYCKTGNQIPIKLNAAVLYNEGQEPTGGIVSFRDVSELEKYRQTLEKDTQFTGIIGHSKQMQEIFNLVKEVADSDAPVLISGESGTGKEMLANAIQQTSGRKEMPFIKINCSVFPDNLLASELFGHVKGAFTDAIKDRLGRFEMADKGTIFLDEVAETPLHMQIQLLRVLQEGTFERIGESLTRKVDVRVIAATNIDIKEALTTGKFREDLFFRLSVIPIVIPPLRERKPDIYPLVNHFLKKYSLLYKKEITEIDENALDLLMNHNWPGNIRELENVIEYAFVRTPGGNIIESSKLPPGLKSNISQNNGFHISYSRNEISERTHLLQMLEKHHWNKGKVAFELKIGRTTLWRKMKKYGLGIE